MFQILCPEKWKTSQRAVLTQKKCFGPAHKNFQNAAQIGGRTQFEVQRTTYFKGLHTFQCFLQLHGMGSGRNRPTSRSWWLCLHLLAVPYLRSHQHHPPPPPPTNMSTVSNQTILTLLQNSYSWHKVAAQTHVSHSTVRRHYSAISYTLPRQCGEHPARHSAQGQKPLVHKITSGAAHTATELKRTLDMGVCVHTIRDTLKQEGLVSKVEVNRPVPSKACQSTG